MSLHARAAARGARRPPYGGRGLKSSLRLRRPVAQRSPSVWRAWIEIKEDATRNYLSLVALRMEGVD